MSSAPVFFDPEGKRVKVVSTGLKILSAFAAVFTVLFIGSLFITPIVIQQKNAKRKVTIVQFPKLYTTPVPSGIILGKYRADLAKEISREHRQRKQQPEAVQTVIGFFAPWMDTSMASLRANSSHLTDLMPQWLRLNADGSAIIDKDFDPALNPRNLEAIQICRKNNVKILPILSNSNGETFAPNSVHALFASKDKEQKMAALIRDWLIVHQMRGINIDFENLDSTDYAKVPDFLQIVRDTFKGSQLLVTTDLEADVPANLVEKITAPCDYVVLMAYDEHGETDKPGPISGTYWTQNLINNMLKVIPKDKFVLGMGAYSYDWQSGVSDAQTDSFEEALTSAKDYAENENPDTIKFDPISLNSYFQYVDENGEAHTVWMQDALSLYNQWSIAKTAGINGFAIWAMGQEDPTIWSVLDRNVNSISNPSLLFSTLRYPFDVQNIGKGEILSIKDVSKVGHRKLTTDPATGLILTSVYTSFPTSYVVQHEGYRRGYLALTFDDGPDPTYTPQVLKILQQEDVPATFFFIGKNMENNPGLTKQAYDDGNEIGSHTFFHPNLGMVSRWRVDLELNATQRSIETITGRSTTLFRPPYNADRDPGTPIEVIPITIANAMGYLTVGESIDPRDWDPYVLDPKTNSARPRTATDIENDAVAQSVSHDIADTSSREGGNCILLHDAGGDRSRTIAALPKIIEKLKEKGFKFVTVGQLINLSRNQVMPRLSPKEQFVITLDGIVFRIVFGGLYILAICFISAIFLGFLRIVIIFPLAILHGKRTKSTVFSPTYAPTVSMLIAAYNESRVIVQTIESILASAYSLHEIVIVDDGSTDDTHEKLLEAFKHDPRIKIFSKANGGKAEALAYALSNSTGEIMVSVDADTVLDENAVGLLVRHFENEKIGAVAGNVQVGNATNAITTWQSIEYTTSQNIDRRGLAYLNAVTVVPGALGAWRRSAVIEAGGHSSDTLAEDMDLTWRIRRNGWIIETESEAFAFTEAPETVKAFARQRFRWAFGTLQCLAKNKDAVFKYGFFGRLALPMLWIFQVFVQILAPLIDFQIILAIIGVIFSMTASQSSTIEISPLAQAAATLSQAALLYAIFFLVEFISAVVAYRLEKKPMGQLTWLFFQRFVYRQVLYYVVLKAIRMAIRGARQGWGKLDRTATVRLGGSGRLN